MRVLDEIIGNLPVLKKPRNECSSWFLNENNGVNRPKKFID